MRICTGEVCVRRKQSVAQRLRFLAGDKQRVLRIARRMVRRKIQRLKVVKIGFNLRTFLDRVAQIAKDPNNLVHRLDDGMLRAEGPANAGEGDVEAARNYFAETESCISKESPTAPEIVRIVASRPPRATFVLQFVHCLSDIALGSARRGFQPKIVESA